MTRSSTSSSRAKGRSGPIKSQLRKRPPRKHVEAAAVKNPAAERVYKHCPLCGSTEIRLATESIELQPRGRGVVRLTAKCRNCAACGEKFLTADSQRQIDKKLGMVSS